MSLEGDNDEFKLVTYKRPKKPPNSVIPVREVSNLAPDTTIIDNILSRIEICKSEIEKSDLFASAVASLREGTSILSHPKVTEIVCFGLGRVSECLISRFQLAFLLSLRGLYKVEVSLYDPAFTPLDLQILERCSCSVMTENCEGKFKVKDGGTRIFYLPHCPKQLTNNLLWSNWGLGLSRCIVISNSFTAILENSPPRVLRQSAPLVASIVPHMLELALINSFRIFEVFNDTAIHVFPLDKISLLSDDFWGLFSEPTYSDEDVEFVKASLLQNDPKDNSEETHF